MSWLHVERVPAMSLYKATEFMSREIEGKSVFVVLDEQLKTIGEFETIEEAKKFIDIMKNNFSTSAEYRAKFAQHAETFVDLPKKSEEPT
tara:strand:- start:6219 stop:6488 length:270 start_codon:yes stop_codon:yes gene_type:complete